MRAKLLLEAFNIRTEDNLKYADFDVESLYKFRPETMGTITFDEIEEVKKLIGLTGEETEEELRAIRNTIVRYWSDRLEYDIAQAEHDWEIEKASNPDANISEFRKNCTCDIRQDQMSAFTHVIDMLLHSIKESLQVGDVAKCGTIWVKVKDIKDEKAIVEPVHKDDVELGKFKDEEQVLLTDLCKNEDLKGYETVAKIIKSDDGYNVAQDNDPMLVKDASSLKSLLLQLAKYL